MEDTSVTIFREQTRLLYANSRMPILVSVVAGALLCWSLRTVIDHSLLISWFTVFFVVSLARLFLLVSYGNGESEAKEGGQWHRYFQVCAYATAVLWGSTSFLLFPDHSHLHQIVFFMILLGMASGGVSSLCSSLPVVAGFLMLLLLPLTVRLAFLGNSEALLMSLLVLIFLVVVLIGAIKINRSIRENILLHLQSVGREKVLKVSEERYRHIFNNAPLGILHYDAEGKIIDCNEEFVGILNSSRDAIVGLQLPEMLKDQAMISAITNSLTMGEGYFEGDYTAITSKTTTPIRAFFKAIKSAEDVVIGGVGIVEDFTEQKKSEQLVHYHASYDPLTGLPNRRMLLDQLNNEISRARRHGYYGAVLFIDMDNFKTINDSLGHSVGDELLKVVAERISKCIRKEDTAARMGGDEFIIIITELDITVGLASYCARGIAEQISQRLAEPCTIEKRDLHITPSIGVAIFPVGEKGVDDVLKQADSAMYRAKAAGRNAIRFFLPHMQEAADERLRLISEMRSALDKNEFVLYYQPQVDMSGRIVGAEALLRWHHPERGVVLPESFIGIAEETGLIQHIGQWVLQTACNQIKKWQQAGKLDESLVISINISGKEITTPDFVDLVGRVLEETGAEAGNLGIELTEGSLVATRKDIVEKIACLRKLGIKFAVDDFGTGYSSLSYLKSLPLNMLKIDRSFVSDIKDGSQDVVLVDTIISMARNLGLEVIAEGVETEQELSYLNRRGCKVYQGFYFSAPVTADAFDEILKAGVATPAG